MIYIDNPPHTGGWCHLFADTIDELHDFALKVGIARCWYENKRKKFQPHYDVHENRLPEMIRAGAQFVNWRDTPEMLAKRYQHKQPAAI